MSKKIITISIIVAITVAVVVFLINKRNLLSPVPTPIIFDKIIVSEPHIGATIGSPITVYGRAKGSWFFEGVFPIKIYDANDKLLGEGPAHFEGETWMTEEFVNFKGEIEFKEPTTQTGYIIFKNDNPSGLPEHDESFKLPVAF